MTTVANELLNDFEDSGSENENEQDEGFYPDGDGFSARNETNGKDSFGTGNEGVELELDEEDPEDADLENGAPAHLKMEADEDEEETKARVEKMELKGVSDVRSVALLMKQLAPVMEVSPSPKPRNACNASSLFWIHISCEQPS